MEYRLQSMYYSYGSAGRDDLSLLHYIQYSFIIAHEPVDRFASNLDWGTW